MATNSPWAYWRCKQGHNHKTAHQAWVCDEGSKKVEDEYTFKAHLKEFYPEEYARRFGKEG